LLWSEGVSQSATAEKLGITEEQVRTLRYRWWASTARLAAAEKKLQKTFNDLTSLIFRIPNERNSIRVCIKFLDRRRSNKQRHPRETIRTQGIASCHASAHLKSFTTNQKSTGSTGATGPKKASPWHLKNFMASAPQNLLSAGYLKEAGLSWKKSRRVLTSPDPNYREKVELLLNTLQSLKGDEDLFFVDELGPLQVKTVWRRSYAPKGAHPSIRRINIPKGHHPIRCLKCYHQPGNLVLWKIQRLSGNY